VARRYCADHARDFGALEGRKRNYAMVRAHAPWRAEFRPRGRDDEESPAP
jgi:hypothetical protein